jgi:hypothetical protein
MWMADRRAAPPSADAEPLERVGWRRGLIVGCAQALALIPGTSRSGITITTATIVHRHPPRLLAQRGAHVVVADLNLAARKLPQACHRLAFRPPCDQHPTVGIDKRTGGNQDDLDRHSLSPHPRASHER